MSPPLRDKGPSSATFLEGQDPQDSPLPSRRGTEKRGVDLPRSRAARVAAWYEQEAGLLEDAFAAWQPVHAGEEH